MFQPNEVFQAIARQDKRKAHPDMHTYRVLTCEECKKVSGHALFVTMQGDIAPVKVTSVKTWKTRPNDVRVGLKYGLYEYATAEYFDGTPHANQLVIEVTPA